MGLLLALNAAELRWFLLPAVNSGSRMDIWAKCTEAIYVAFSNLGMCVAFKASSLGILVI